jgi:DNA-binding NarL/FixJ family response regulator
MSDTSAPFCKIAADVSIALIDNRTLRRTIFAKYLTAALNKPVIEAADPRSAREAVDGAGKPEKGLARELVLLSIGAETLSGPSANAALSETVSLFPDAAIVVISDSETLVEALAALDAGARGFIPTSLTAHVMLACMKLVLAGGQFVPPYILRSGQAHHPSPTPSSPRTTRRDLRKKDGSRTSTLSGPDSLSISRDGDAEDMEHGEDVCITRRQSEVLELLKQGLQNKQIAYQLNMSESTVKVHVRNLMKKFGAHNRTQAAFNAWQFTQEDAPANVTLLHLPPRPLPHAAGA